MDIKPNDDVHRDKRIFSTGCAGTGRVPAGIRDLLSNIELMAAEQTKMNDCYFETRDWRSCAKEVSWLSFFSSQHSIESNLQLYSRI